MKSLDETQIREEILQKIKSHGKFPDNHGRDVAVFWEKTWPMLGELGFLGFLISKENGGRGYSAQEYVIALETIAGLDPMAAYVINEHSTIGGLGVSTTGSQLQKDKYLDKLATGKILAGFGLTEPGHGSDVTSLKTTAVKDGGNYLINGKKIHISLAEQADIFTVVAGVPTDEKNLNTAFLIEKANPGLRMGEENSSPEGYLIPGAGSIEMDNCVVGADMMLGEVGKAGKVSRGVLEIGRFGLASIYVGNSQTALNLCVQYAHKRNQFGKPISNYQAIQFKLADMRVGIQAARLLVRDAARIYDEGKSTIESGAMAKLFTTEMARNVGIEAIQIHGGHSYLADPPIDWFMRDAKMGEILGGTSEVMRMLISRKVLASQEES
tara:strand:- start:606 stop:1751 length:1146 start_codon:yes stop_codon:yes gene_type:complete